MTLGIGSGSAASRSHGPARIAWFATAALVGLTIGIGLGSADLVAILWGAALAAAVLTLARKIASPSDRTRIVVITGLALAVHMSAALLIHAIAPGFGGGFVTGDDANYFRVSSEVAAHLRGGGAEQLREALLPDADSYLFGTFVFLESALFVVFGPDVRFPLLMNAALAIVTALLVYGTTARIFRDPAGLVALVVVAFWPSLILWSALNLKDMLTITLEVAAVASLVSFQSRPQLLTMVIPIGAAGALVSLRAPVAAVVVVTVAIALLSWRLRASWRFVWEPVAAGSIVALLAFGVTTQAPGPGEQLMAAFERSRQAKAGGAETAFVATPPPATVTSGGAGTSAIDSSSADTPILQRTLAYLPTGLAYSLFAPFPWAARRYQELLAAPEVLLWYGLLIGAAVSVWRARRRWRSLLTPVVMSLGLLAVLALGEGNVGTLFRHRDMLVPFVVVLASPTIVALRGGLRHRRTALSNSVRSAGASRASSA
jgi:hypothetical protein